MFAFPLFLKDNSWLFLTKVIQSYILKKEAGLPCETNIKFVKEGVYMLKQIISTLEKSVGNTRLDFDDKKKIVNDPQIKKQLDKYFKNLIDISKNFKIQKNFTVLNWTS